MMVTGKVHSAAVLLGLRKTLSAVASSLSLAASRQEADDILVELYTQLDLIAAQDGSDTTTMWDNAIRSLGCKDAEKRVRGYFTKAS